MKTGVLCMLWLSYSYQNTRDTSIENQEGNQNWIQIMLQNDQIPRQSKLQILILEQMSKKENVEAAKRSLYIVCQRDLEPGLRCRYLLPRCAKIEALEFDAIYPPNVVLHFRSCKKSFQLKQKIKMNNYLKFKND